MKLPRRILFVTPIFEYPTTHGPSLRIANSLKVLSKLANLHLTFTRKSSSPSQDIQEFSRMNRIEYHDNLLNHFSIIQGTKLLDWLNAIYLVLLAKRLATDTIWFGYGCMTLGLIQACKKINPNLVAICDTDSVQSRYFLRSLPYLKDLSLYHKNYQLGKMMEHDEKVMVQVSNKILAVSEVDEKYYESLNQNKKNVELFYNVIDVSQYRKSHKQKLQHPAIVLTGWYGDNSPMNDGARWFIQEIWPLVNQKIPLATLYLIGKGSQNTMSEFQTDRIRIIGEVPDMVPYLRSADIAVVPLRFESGTRYKILEASACKLPVVSTSLGSEGLNIVPDQDYLLADDPELFARSVIQLLTDSKLKKRISENAYKHVIKQYSLNNLTKQAKMIFARIKV